MIELSLIVWLFGAGRFANFFVSPLLNPSSLDREIEAVDSGRYRAGVVCMIMWACYVSEFQNSIQSDTHRIHQLFCSLAIPGHPLACFPWGIIYNNHFLHVIDITIHVGNNATLRNDGSNLIARLKDFYSRYYSASCMTVTVVSEGDWSEMTRLGSVSL